MRRNLVSVCQVWWTILGSVYLWASLFNSFLHRHVQSNLFAQSWKYLQLCMKTMTIFKSCSRASVVCLQGSGRSLSPYPTTGCFRFFFLFFFLWIVRDPPPPEAGFCVMGWLFWCSRESFFSIIGSCVLPTCWDSSWLPELGTNGQDYRVLHLPEQYDKWISAEIIWAATTSSVACHVCSLGFDNA